MHDVVIIGGGPAGLSAALNGAAEGLDVLLLERNSVLGGQAGTSSRIENYLGFPKGVAGEPLTQRAAAQARRLGAALETDAAVTGVEHNVVTGLWVVHCGNQRHVAKTVITATGVDYRRLEVPGGNSEHVLYGAPSSAHEECTGQPVVVIGGGNSAGQAALNLAKIGATVTLLVRRPIFHTMSHYLIERIALHPEIEPSIGEASAIDSASVYIERPATTIPAYRVFVYIGMQPRTDFIHHCCRIERPGYVHTDDKFAANEDGLFAAGDVRAGSFKRVAAAVGEGAIAAASAWRKVFDVK